MVAPKFYPSHDHQPNGEVWKGIAFGIVAGILLVTVGFLLTRLFTGW